MLDITFNNLSKADGSALLSENNTIVQAAVFGPVDIAQSKMNHEEAVVEILYKPKLSIPITSPSFDQVREVENLLRCVFKEIILTQLHPRTSISILVQEIYNGGSLLSSIINASCCALIDAGVPLKCPITGVAVESEGARSCPIDLVFDNDLNIIALLMRDAIDEENFRKAITTGQQLATRNFAVIRDRVRQRFA